MKGRAASMAPAADWSELPTELLHLISERIDTEIDLIRFRSVCSNWRSSSIPKHHLNILPFKFPLFKFRSLSDSINNNNTLPFCYLSKRSLFLIKPPQQQHRPWLIRVTQKSLGKTKLSQPSLISFDFPYVLDFNPLSVLHLGCEFLMEEDFRYPSEFMCPEKVIVVTCHHGKKLLALSIIKYPPYLLLIRCSDGHRFVIPNLSTPIVDICLFKQQIYAIDKTGRTFTVVIDDLNVELVAEPEPLVGGGGDIKFLVESEGDLLLVDVYHDDLMIHVFTFDEKAKKWVKFKKNLGDRVLFLGDGCSFSASASDLCVSRGNCVIFMNNIFFFSHMKMNFGMSIFFHLDQGRRQLSPLSNYPDYYNLFWPPPEWIVKSCIPN